uniref:DNA repair protein SWI5 homolog n=1 Tax=Canis lupus dingo TaxID=286419 RepID=A0A8C0KY42_CANLU
MDPSALHTPPRRGPRTPGLRRWITSRDPHLAPHTPCPHLGPYLPLPNSLPPTPPRNPLLSERTDSRFNQPFVFGFLSRTQPGLSQSCRGAFQSPRPSPKSGQADGASKDSLRLDIQKLKEKRDLLDKEITQLISEGYSVDELEDHISQLHEYNDIKDIGQMLLGKLGEQQDPRGPARAQREGGSISPGVWILLLGPLTCQPSHPSQLAHCSNARSSCTALTGVPRVFSLNVEPASEPQADLSTNSSTC